MSAKQYLKMADVFEQLKEPNPENEIAFDLNVGYITVLACEYAAHAINSHDELVAENDRLVSALYEVDRVLSEMQKNGAYGLDDIIDEVSSAIQSWSEE